MIEFVVKVIGASVLVLLAAFVLGCIAAIPVYFLWNWLMPALFHLPVLTFFQAVGLSVLCTCLFKGTASSKS